MTAEPGLGREGAGLRADRGERALRRRPRLAGRPRPLASCPTRRSRRTCPCASRSTLPRGHARGFVPIVFAGEREGPGRGARRLRRILAPLPALYAENVAHYRAPCGADGLRSPRPTPPRHRRSPGRRWAWTRGSPRTRGSGTGLLAGFRTSGDSERPGFAWFFGRDALWTRAGPPLLRRLRLGRGRPRVPAPRAARGRQGPARDLAERPALPWFTDYPYPWNSADATPLFVIAHADHWRATGDRALPGRELRDAIVKAWRFTAGTDTDGNGLVENTTLRPRLGGGRRPLSAARGDLPAGRVDRGLPRPRRAGRRAGRAPPWPRRRARGAERTRAAVEKTYWLAEPRLLRFRHARPRRESRGGAAAPSARGGRPASRRSRGAASSTRTP